LGIALSGGGIRSATFNLGLLQAFNSKGLLKRADYLSSVSGGEYINSFVQKRLRQNCDYDKLFDKDEIDRLRGYGDYLRPYSGVRKVYESVTFYLAFIILALLHFIWYFLFFLAIVSALLLFFNTLPTISFFYLRLQKPPPSISTRANNRPIF